MIELLIAVLIGAFIGWHVPQPSWARQIEDKVVDEAGKISKPKQ
jgi:hypothetical protein